MSEENQGRSSGERRDRRRVLTAISCNWGWDEAVPKHGKVTSLSLQGCFLQTTVYGERDKFLHVHLWLPTSTWLKLRGTIMYIMEGIGFGIRFDAPNDEEERHLLLAINHFAANPPLKR